LLIDFARAESDWYRNRLYGDASQQIVKKTLPALATPNCIGTSGAVSQFEHSDDGNSDLFVASLQSHRLEELACAFALTFDGHRGRRVEH